MELRSAGPDDVASLLAIYAPLVETTAVSFELEPPSEAELAARVRAVQERHPWLVCEGGGQTLGYAYAGPFRKRPAYAWSAESTVYVHPDHRGRGVARRLYVALMELLRLQGFRNAFAVITLPNDASVRLHESVGFQHVGTLPAVGYKLDSWHDVGLWQLALSDPDSPAPLRSPEEVLGSAAGRRALGGM